MFFFLFIITKKTISSQRQPSEVQSRCKGASGSRPQGLWGSRPPDFWGSRFKNYGAQGLKSSGAQDLKTSGAQDLWGSRRQGLKVHFVKTSGVHKSSVSYPDPEQDPDPEVFWIKGLKKCQKC